MKTLNIFHIAGLVFTVAAFSAFTSHAEVSATAITKSLAAVRAPELPARAGSLVAKAPLVDQEATTVEVVKAAIASNPASAAPVVGAIAKAAPKMAALAAATAVSLQPKQAAAIAKAAAGAAPTEAEKIIAAMSKQAPALSSVITQAVHSTAIASAKASPGGLQAAPRVGPPFVERTGTQGEISRTNTVVAPPGERDYSAP